MTALSIEELESSHRPRAVQWLIALNVAVFYVQWNFVGSGNMGHALGFTSRNLSDAPWTVVSLVTYMFVHAGVWQLVLNMYMLWLFGPRLERVWSAGEFTRYYILCALGGWLFHLLFARDSLLVGSSAAVLGVMLAYAARWPDDEVYLFGMMPVRARWLAPAMGGVLVGAGVLGGGDASGVAYLAHVGGIAAGWLYLRSSMSTSIDRLRQRVSQLPDVAEELPRAIPRSMPRVRERGGVIDDVVARSNAALSQRAVKASPAPGREGHQLTDLNVVLDKISQQGIDSLTSDERKLLEEMSQELRRKE